MGPWLKIEFGHAGSINRYNYGQSRVFFQAVVILELGVVAYNEN
jgi:hypothetical protein